MLVGAVDIGSNAMRFLVASAMEYEGKWHFQRVEYLRYPIRLGEDVFQNQQIGNAKIEKLRKMLLAFKNMFEVFEVVEYAVCATSAMRDAANNKQVVELIKNELGIDIQIIDGKTEAKLIEQALARYLTDGNYLHIDVGGGSTELNVISKFEKIASHSFNVGTVRAIHHGISYSDWNDIQTWIDTHKLPHLAAIGTGGNVKKLHELALVNADAPVSLDFVRAQLAEFEQLTVEQRMQKFKLNQDRADVIIPATHIFLNIMQWAGCDKLYAPNVGLVDGIAVKVWSKIIDQKN